MAEADAVQDLEFEGNTNWWAVLEAVQEHWLGSFLLNSLGYALIILPAALLIRRLKDSPSIKSGQGPVNHLLKLLVFGDSDPLSDVEEGKVAGESKSQGTQEAATEQLSTTQYCSKLMFCIVGLQGAYLTWGVLQERVMTQSYDGDKFTNSQFLVFVNRILALVVALTYIIATKQPRHSTPLYKYSYASISNTLSSWCQYEALKFVSFPTQVLAKSSKVIPVMVMGKVVSNRTYSWHEYLTASMMSVGVALFLLATDSSDNKHTVETTFAGVIILLGYMMFDSFTSNWQSELFKQYKVSSVQMMFGVNLFSCVFTVGSLLFRGVFFSSLGFLFQHKEFAFHAALLSICSAVGQLFIFNTIAAFGPLIFTLIMTTRQAISILLSCFIYSHTLTAQAMVGVAVVFAALFLRAYCRSQDRKGSK